MSSPLKPIAVMVAYFYFVKNIGPRFMANRRPFELKFAIRLYNIVQILLNAFLFKEVSNNIVNIKTSM